ncbi:FRG1-like domain protein [uncultured archaeon]|nr:FRG1-like domain protein [uncultured archaeon]
MNEIVEASAPPVSEPKPIVIEKETEEDDAISSADISAVSGTPDIQVTLFWNDDVDLDLHVTDPYNEEIYYKHKTSASGGILDRDNMCTNWVQNAPENIIWPENKAPSGHYKIKVVYYADCASHPDPITFTVKVYIKGQEFDYPMTISPPENPSGGIIVWEFNYPNVKALTLRGNVGYYTGLGPYRDNDNTRVNAKHFLVQLQKGTDDTLLGQGYTDSNGNFVINIDNPGADGVIPVLYAYHKWDVGETGRTQLTSRELRVIRQGTSLSGLVDVYSWKLGGSPQQFSDGDHTFVGSLDVPKGEQFERACWLLDDLNRVFLYTPGDPGGCTIKWSPTSTDGCFFSYSDKLVHMRADDPITTDNGAIHEYGHNIMYNVWNNAILLTDCPDTGHWITQAYGPICAWKEGWTEFLPLAVNNDPIYHVIKVGTVETSVDLENAVVEGSSETWAKGDQCEGRVAGALWDQLDNTPTEGTDAYSFGFNPIWYAMVNNGAVVKDFKKFWRVWLGKGNSIYSANCLLQNTIDYWPSRSIALRTNNGQYVCADGGGGHELVADRNWIGSWETFKLIDLGNSNVVLRASNGQFVCAESGGGGVIVADRNHFDAWETFKLVDFGNGNIALRANNGQYVCARNGGGGLVIAKSDAVGKWETFELIDLTPTPVALRASNGQYVCAEYGGGDGVVANRNARSIWETFNLINLLDGNVALQAYNGQYLCAENGGGYPVVANHNWIGEWETFKLIDLGSGNVALQANNGQYVCAEFGGGDVVTANRNIRSTWETFGLSHVSLSPAKSDDSLTTERGNASISGRSECSVCASR